MVKREIIMLYLISLIAAAVPMILYLIIIWQFDFYNIKPFKFIFKIFMWGAIGAIFFAIIGSGIVSESLSLLIKKPTELNHISTIVIAPYIEEITKGIFLFITFSNKKVDFITDGLLYGSAIGLGFGMTENFLYFITYGHSFSQWFSIVVIRSLFSGVMHCVSTGTLGAFIGYSKFNPLKNRIVFILIGLTIAISIHFAWNLSVSMESTTAIGFLFMLVTILIFIFLYALAINTEKKMIFNELYEEFKNGLIPLEHLIILNSGTRNKSGWVDESIRKPYISASTTLAFRKMELKNSSGLSKTFYANDVEYYRQFIFNLLHINAKLE